MAHYSALLVLLFAFLASVHCGVLPVVTYGSSYAAHSVDHSLAAPLVAAAPAAPLLAAAPAPLVAAPAAAAPFVAGYPAPYYAF